MPKAVCDKFLGYDCSEKVGTVKDTCVAVDVSFSFTFECSYYGLHFYVSISVLPRHFLAKLRTNLLMVVWLTAACTRNSRRRSGENLTCRFL